MEGRAFLDVARELLAGKTEAHWRAAAGRAYYGLFLEARAALQRWGIKIPPGPGIHAFVRLRFSQNADPDLRRIGDALDRLGQLRNYADYEVPVSPSFTSDAKAQQAVAKATATLTLLDGIDGNPIRRSAAVKAIRTAWP
jgi:uncharacterized protein (UPF0332 family)